jgi:hypothetical protein
MRARYGVRIHMLGKSLHIGYYYRLEEAAVRACPYDPMPLLLYGPRADTNLEWSSSSHADIAAAVDNTILQSKGLDVHQAWLMH